VRKKKLNPIILIDDQPISGFAGSDLLALEPFAKVAAGVALGTTGPFTIGVYAGWGQGKTSLLKRTKGLIDEANDPNVATVWFNAWQYEREEHPLFPLIAAIIEAVEEKATGVSVFRDLHKSLKGLLCGLKVSFKPLGIGVDLDLNQAVQADHALRESILQLETLYPRAFSELEDLAKRMKDKAKIVVFIDDLDRCLPDKALALLESIKLVLNQPGFIFLLALDPEIVIPFLTKRYRVQYGVKAEEAENTARTYLHKIVQLQFDIPHHPERKFTDYIEKLVDSNPIMGLAFRDITDVLSVGASRNPRELVRLLNNLIIDLELWDAEKIETPEAGTVPADETPDQTEKRRRRNVLICMTISRVLLHYLGPATTRTLALSNEVYEVPSETDAEEEPASAELMNTRRPDEKGEWSNALQKVWQHKVLSDVLRKHGEVWLTTPQLRQLVYDFYQERDTAWTTSETEREIFDRAVRGALGLEPDAPIPAERLKEVTNLNLLGESDFGDAGMQLVAKLTGLQHLFDLTGLQALDLGGTKVGDAGLVHLSGLTGLQQLSLMNTQVTDAGLEHLAGLTGLQALFLSGPQVSDAGLAHLADLTGLQWLSLMNTQVGDAGLAHLADLTGLHWLYLGHTKVGDAGLEHLAGLTGLREIWLNSTQVTDAGLAHLFGLTGLRRLWLNTTKITDAGVQALKKKLPDCIVFRE
jgi:hypothetical protein